MKLKMQAADFIDRMNKALPFASYDSTHAAFMLTHLKVTSKGMLRVTVVNASAGCRVQFKLDEGDFEPGEICLLTDSVDHLVRALPSSGSVKVIVSEGKNNQMKVRVTAGDSFSASVPCTDPEMFVDIGKPTDAEWFDLDADEISRIVDATGWAAGKDVQNRPILTGIHFTPNYSEASNGHLIARISKSMIKDDVVVPKVFLDKVRTLVKKDEPLKLQGGDRIWVRAEGWAAFCNLVHGQYPKVEDYILKPDDEGKAQAPGYGSVEVNSVHLSRPHILDIVQRASRAAGPCALRFSMKDEKLTITSVPRANQTADDLPVRISQRLDWSAEGANPGGFDFLQAHGLDPKYLASALSSFQGDLVRLLWCPTVRNFQLDDSEFSVLIMPIAL